MDDQFSNKVIQDLENSGFQSEMKAIGAFLTRGWKCTGGVSFFDRDEQITREIDFEAYRPLWKEIDKTTVECFFFLVGEVKKTKKPWVVFKAKLDRKHHTDAWDNLIFHDNFPREPGLQVKLTLALSRSSLLTQCRWRGYGIHESFKKPDQSSRWFSAFVSSCKAAEYTLEANSWEVETTAKSWNPDEGAYLYFIKPVVILDGILLSAEILENGTIEVQEIAAAPMSFEYRSRQYARGGYKVDVVRLDSLDNYISDSEKRQQYIFDRMLKLIRAASAA
jgi:hypothetical protein